MPIYEYRCHDCGQVFEALQRIADEPLDACRRCGGSARRIISSPAIHFVGSGWYVTDYAKKGEARKDGAPEKGKGKREGSGESPATTGNGSGKQAAGSRTPAPRSEKTSPAGGEARAGSPS